MTRPFVFSRYSCATLPALPEKRSRRNSYLAGMNRHALVFLLLVLAACVPFTPSAYGQIQSTITCPPGEGYWDVLSIMMMDPGLAAGYHMEGITAGLPSAYVYTIWDEAQTKVYYVKNPQGNPWDINLYDSNYIYQWVTELQEWNGVNHWNDPTSCKKFNNGSQNSTADFSMRWAARCAAPGGANSTIWNAPPTTQPNNTNYYTYVDQQLQNQPQNLDYALLELEKPWGSMDITDHRANPPLQFPISILPLIYSYSCSVSNNVNSCQFREMFEYGFDTTVNPVDKVKHSYGWVRWQYYINLNLGNPDLPAVWVLSNISTSDQLMPGQVNLNFQCFE
jgi:hypothetical protein